MTESIPFDGQVMLWIQQQLHSPWGDAVFPWITYLGEAGLCWLILCAVLLLLKKQRQTGAAVLLAVALGFVTGELILKNIVCRPRPFQAFPDFTPLLISPPSGWSFPSGHSCSSFAAASVLLSRRHKLGIPALLLACLIAFSRVYLFVHWPSDILAGMLLGVASAAVVHLLWPKILGLWGAVNDRFKKTE